MHRRPLPLLRPLLTLGSCLFVAVVCLLLFVRIDRVVIAEGRLAGGTVAVYAPWEGRVEGIFVAPGDSVRAGAPLVAFESSPLRAQDEQIRARIANLSDRIVVLRAERGRLASQIHPAEVLQASRDLERSRLELSSAEIQFDLKKQLWDMGLTTKLELQDSELALDLARVALKEAEAAGPVLEARHRDQIEKLDGEIRNLAGQIAEERAAVGETDRMLALDTLAADTRGIVLGANLFELMGRTVTRGEEILRLSTGPADRFEGAVFDAGRASARPGHRVKIRLEGYPWLLHGTLAGRLDFVDDCRSGGGFPVKVSFDPSTAPGPLYDGMKGQARIIVDEKVSLGHLLIERLAGTKKR